MATMVKCCVWLQVVSYTFNLIPVFLLFDLIELNYASGPHHCIICEHHVCLVDYIACVGTVKYMLLSQIDVPGNEWS